MKNFSFIVKSTTLFSRLALASLLACASIACSEVEPEPSSGTDLVSPSSVGDWATWETLTYRERLSDAIAAELYFHGWEGELALQLERHGVSAYTEAVTREGQRCFGRRDYREQPTDPAEVSALDALSAALESLQDGHQTTCGPCVHCGQAFLQIDTPEHTAALSADPGFDPAHWCATGETLQDPYSAEIISLAADLSQRLERRLEELPPGAALSVPPRVRLAVLDPQKTSDHHQRSAPEDPPQWPFEAIRLDEMAARLSVTQSAFIQTSLSGELAAAVWAQCLTLEAAQHTPEAPCASNDYFFVAQDSVTYAIACAPALPKVRSMSTDLDMPE